jgi:hypothetical protein
VIGHRQRLGIALGLVVDAARANRVDVAPVGLALRMLLRVPVDLARGGDQKASAMTPVIGEVAGVRSPWSALLRPRGRPTELRGGDEPQRVFPE